MVARAAARATARATTRRTTRRTTSRPSGGGKGGGCGYEYGVGYATMPPPSAQPPFPEAWPGMEGIPQPGLCVMHGFYPMANMPYMGPGGYSFPAGAVQYAQPVSRTSESSVSCEGGNWRWWGGYWPMQLPLSRVHACLCLCAGQGAASKVQNIAPFPTHPDVFSCPSPPCLGPGAATAPSQGAEPPLPSAGVPHAGGDAKKAGGKPEGASTAEA